MNTPDCSTPKVTLLNYTPLPMETVYSVWEMSKTEDPLRTPQQIKDDVPADEIEELFRAVILQRIPIGEHLHFIFALENVSVSWREQAVRHRIGTKVSPERVGSDIVMMDVIPNLADSSWWSQCFVGDTRVKLLNGTAPTMVELAERGGEFWVYSCDSHGRVVPGRAHSARLTRRESRLVEVELDNGDKEYCTPDHLWMLRDGTYQEAECLVPGTSLMPCYSKVDKYGYEMFKEPTDGRWKYTHQRVDGELNGELPKEHVVHHSSFDKLNNSPDYLIRMDKLDHIKYHAALIVERMKSDPVGHKLSLSKGQKRAWENMTEDERDLWRQRAAAARSHINPDKRNIASKKFMDSRWKDKEWRAKMLPVLAQNGAKTAGRKCTPATKAKMAASAKKRFAKNGAPPGFNHKVAAVRELVEVEDVYDITVDEYHNFALASGVFVHNSMRIQDMSKFADKGAYRLPGTVAEHKDPEVAERFHKGMKYAQDTYKWLVHERDIPMEDARELVGLGAQHRISWDLNIGSLQHIVGKRGCWILQLGIWGPIIIGMINELATKVHPIFRELVSPPCLKGDDFIGCVYQEECRRRYTGDDKLPPCPLHLNHHHVSEGVKGALPIMLGKVDIPMKKEMADRAEDYRRFWNRDPYTGKRQ